MIYLLNLSERDYLRHTLRSLPWIEDLKQSIANYYTYSSEIINPHSTSTRSSPVYLSPNIQVIHISVDFEEKYLQEKLLGPENLSHFLAANPYHTSAIHRIFQMLYNQLDLIQFYTANTTECKVYYIPQGTMAPEAGNYVDTMYERYVQIRTTLYDYHRVAIIIIIITIIHNINITILFRKFICANVMAFDDLVEFQNEFTLRRMGKLIQQGRKYIVNDGDIISFQHGK